jgi:hypothetical protein
METCRSLLSILGARIKKNEQGPLSLLSTTEELLERKISGSGLESREYGRRDPPRWPRGTLYPLSFPARNDLARIPSKVT